MYLRSHGNFLPADLEKFSQALADAGAIAQVDLSPESKIVAIFDASQILRVADTFVQCFDCDDSDFIVNNGYNLRYARCSYLGDFYPEIELMEDINSGDMIHCSVWGERYFECDSCGCQDDRDTATYSPLRDETLCEVCFERLSHGEVQHFNGPSKRFSGDNSFGCSRSFGVELETNGGYCSESYAFDGKEDSSIGGTEYVSHVLRGDAGFKELKDFMASGEGIEYGDNCGVHVHVNVSDLNNEELWSVYLAYLLCFDYFADKVKSHRIDNSMCMETSDYDIEHAFDEYRAGTTFGGYATYQDRYKWINCDAYGKHSTFENRLHHASWDYNEVAAWIKLNLRFVRAARYLRFSRRDSIATARAKAQVALQWAASGSLDTPYTAPAREPAREPASLACA